MEATASEKDAGATPPDEANRKKRRQELDKRVSAALRAVQPCEF
jgi:hypothetical protein